MQPLGCRVLNTEHAGVKLLGCRMLHTEQAKAFTPAHADVQPFGR
jgi:hypothetical protein